jgi:hypothetical protein
MIAAEAVQCHTPAVSSSESSWLASLRPSRIREVQGGALAWTRVRLIDASGMGEALRPMLECLGVQVELCRVGQARHLAAALSAPQVPFVVVECHGDEGSIVLDELAEEVQRFQPFGPRVSPDDVRRVADLHGATVIATGCDMGAEPMADAFLDAGAEAYVAPLGAPFGYASVFAPAMLFYELTEGRSIDAAVERLRAHDDELSMWQLVRPADELA